MTAPCLCCDVTTKLSMPQAGVHIFIRIIELVNAGGIYSYSPGVNIGGIYIYTYAPFRHKNAYRALETRCIPLFPHRGKGVHWWCYPPSRVDPQISLVMLVVFLCVNCSWLILQTDIESMYGASKEPSAARTKERSATMGKQRQPADYSPAIYWSFSGWTRRQCMAS